MQSKAVLPKFDSPDKQPLWMSWLRLIRVSAIPSTIANILTGFLVVHQSWEPIMDLTWLIFSSVCLYASGMVLNDLCDVEFDRHNNPSRPIPTGEIAARHAWCVYICLTTLGLLAASIAGTSSLFIAACLVIAIFLYDLALKQTALAPIVMGSCRFLNLLLGASTYNPVGADELPGWPLDLAVIATSLAVLIIGVTLLAKNENNVISRAHLGRSIFVIFLGLTGYALAPRFTESMPWTWLIYFLALCFIGFEIAKKSRDAIRCADGVHVRRTVITSLQSLILLDAAVCLLVSNNLVYPLIVLSLIIPSRRLARVISPT